MPGDAGSRVRLPRIPRRRPTWDEVALGVFLLYVLVAGPLVLARLGDFQWFMRDEWIFLTGRDGSDPLEPLNAHWVTLPRLAYDALWELTGIRRYWPYQGLNVALHLTVCVLIWIVMRRAQVHAWIATAAASLLVLFGPGAQDIVWAFQISLNGALVFGLAQVLLSDHDGRWDRRDSLGLACGLLGLMCSGVAIVMVGAVGLAVLIRRGPLLALAHAAPPAVVYVAWTVVYEPTTSSPFGRPPPNELVGWVGIGVEGTLRALAAYRPLEVVFALVLVVGLVLAWSPWQREGLAEARRRLAAPTALLAGFVAMFAITAWGRWRPGPANAILSSRYLHVGAALLLPALAVGAAEVARRWRPALPILVVALLIPIPANLDGFEPLYFGETYNIERSRVMTTAPRLPFADDVPRDVEPMPDPYAGGEVTIGFLLDAVDDGKLVPSDLPLTDRVVNEFRIRLGLRQQARVEEGFPQGCAPREVPFDLHLDEGETLLISGAVTIATVDDDGVQSSPGVRFDVGSGTELEAVLPELDLRIWPGQRGPRFVICTEAA